MNSNTANEENVKPLPQEQEIDLLELAKKVWNSRKLILKVCGIGTLIGLIIGLSTPEEYTASTLIAPEGYRKSSSSGMSALADMADIDISSSTTTERDAIYPSLYPSIVNSTPFLIRLFNIKIHEQRDSTIITLSQYLKEHQKKTWWSTITSAPFRLIGWTMSLFSEKEEVEKTKHTIDPFRLTREEAGMAGTIASRINIEVDKKKRTITIFVTMQDPLVAAVVADTVGAHLKEYVTEYRTAKARRILEYAKRLRQEAQMEYHKAQKEYTRYADANRGLVKLTSRAELAKLENEMNLALVTYKQAEQQVQVAIAKVEKVRPVYTVIQPVQVPLRPSKPQKMMILMACIFLSGAGSVGWILFARDFLKNMKRIAFDRR
ncbi:Wzz/FepE/Etk N-terminal domain-containing protein [Bacteroides oleiciplenus]|uniref:Chain-length determining protein n=1 Tax=Bacteroides oleiciplenus TaxID=626931 RepID=A0A3E5AV57_9BACE|nr:Wzz/FepE/Etk N-terminal domain-containing protein [Bacteroides oleiciplenus]RGN29203.1 chain-length determining protein [Bacteroides oleiciplenus]